MTDIAAIEERLADIKEQITNGGGSINLNTVRIGASINTIRFLAEGGFYVIENDDLLALLQSNQELRGQVERLEKIQEQKVLAGQVGVLTAILKHGSKANGDLERAIEILTEKLKQALADKEGEG